MIDMPNDPNSLNNQNSGNLNGTDEKKYQDIPTTFFRPIEEVQSQQEELIKNYEATKNKEMNEPAIDYSNEVRALEKKLNQKKYSMPLLGVLVIVILVNVAWFLGVQLLIVPKYEEYVSQSEEIWENYNVLKSRVDAIVGE